jgi:hypothetical protein
MTISLRSLVHFTLSSAFGLTGCDDGRLDVLEPLASGGDSGTSGAAGAASGAVAGSMGRGGVYGGGGSGPAGSGGRSSLPSPFVIDDFEDGNTESLSIRQGYWYSTPDESEACSAYFRIEAIVDRPSNTHAIRAQGGNCTEWGSLLGLDLGGTVLTFDASSFDELRFWARADPGSETSVSVSLMDPRHFDTAVELTDEWREYVLPLDGFVFNDQGTEEPFDPDVLTHLQFFIFAPGAVDYWLDDIAFVRSE